MQRFSIYSLLSNAIRKNPGWQPHWRDGEPQGSYDVVIAGGGTLGLATAYYLAKEHSVRNVAVLADGLIGCGHPSPGAAVLHVHREQMQAAKILNSSIDAYQNLARELNFNIMFARRGSVSLCFGQDALAGHRHADAIARLAGVSSRLVGAADARKLVPAFTKRTPPGCEILAGVAQPEGGIVNPVAVDWSFARAADAQGIDILQECRVEGIRHRDGRVRGVETSRGLIRARKVALMETGRISELAAMAGASIPMRTVPWHTLISEPVRPALKASVLAPELGISVSQLTGGELIVTQINRERMSRASGSEQAAINDMSHAFARLFPHLAGLKITQAWRGMADFTPDGSPVSGPSEMRGLYAGGGWGTEEVLAAPAAGRHLARTIAEDKISELTEPFSPDRFASGDLVYEAEGRGQRVA